MINFTTTETTEYTLIELSFEGTLEPAILENLKPPLVDGKKGVVISGKAPIWLYAYLTHHYHPTAWVATHDPRLGGIIVQTHSKLATIGEIKNLSEAANAIV